MKKIKHSIKKNLYLIIVILIICVTLLLRFTENRDIEEDTQLSEEHNEEPIDIILDDFEYTIHEEKIQINKYIGEDDILTIPSEISGVPVTALAKDSIPDSIREIYLPETITNLDKKVFNNCIKLELIDIEQGNEKYASEDGVLFSKSMDNLIKYPAGRTETIYSIPEGVSNISEEAFLDNRFILKAEFPDSLEQIGASAFSGCICLNRVDLPENINELADDIFYQCRRLSSIQISNTVTSIGKGAFADSGLSAIQIPESVTVIGDEAFIGTGITEIIIPASVLHIGKDLFTSCGNLEKVIIEGKLSTVTKNMFRGCKSLTSIHLPKTVSSVEGGAFLGCSDLQEIDIDEKNLYLKEQDRMLLTIDGTKLLYVFEELRYQEEIIIPEGVTEIYDYVFYQFSSLIDVTLPRTLQIIGSYSFSECRHLAEVVIPESVYTIGEHAFSLCEELKYIKIPEGLKFIESGTFGNCIKLEEVLLPESLVNIGPFAFSHCHSLNKIKLPENLVEIGLRAFQSCFSLSKLEIPDSVVTIGQSAFSQAGLTEIKMSRNISVLEKDVLTFTKIEKIYLPESLRLIEAGAFSGCKNLKEIYFVSDAPELVEEDFRTGSEELVIYYKEGTKGWTNPWNRYRTESY